MYTRVGTSLKRDKVSVTRRNYVLFGWAFFCFSFSVFLFWPYHWSCGVSVPDKGENPLQWKCRVSTTGLFREVLKNVCGGHWAWNKQSCVRPYKFAKRANIRLNALTFKGKRHGWGPGPRSGEAAGRQNARIPPPLQQRFEEQHVGWNHKLLSNVRRHPRQASHTGSPWADVACT